MSCSQFGYSSNPATTQLLMAGQTTGQQLHGTSSTTGQPCCESGRPVMTDPITGQTVCSCQYDAQLLNYQRLAASGLPLNMYGTAAAAAAAAAAYGGEQGFLPLSAEQSAFYSPSANGFDLKDNLDAWRSLPYAASVYYPYESAALAGYPFPNGYAVDLNGARRKNATRETTSTLKAWLNEHRKNPYPTKGEKIMLAIITKMTLTQVSTWFANARRRLKKENKMTWSPRNRCDDDDPDGDDGDGTGRTKDGDHDTASKDGGSQDEDRHGDRVQDMEALDDGKVEFVDVDDDSKSCESAMNDLHVHTNSSDKENRFVSKAPTISPVSEGLGTDSESSQASLLSPSAGVTVGNTDLPTTPKPRIWSLVDTATSGSNTTSGTNSGAGSSSLPTVTSPGAARLSPLQRAARLEYLSPYPKPAAWYSGTLGSISATNGVPGSFPLSAVYTCPPMVNPASLSSMASPVTSTGSSSLPGSAVLTESSAASAVSSLNRLRTAAAAFPTVELHGKTVQSGVGTTGGGTVFGLAVPGGRVVPAATVAPPGSTSGQNRVVS